MNPEEHAELEFYTKINGTRMVTVKLDDERQDTRTESEWLAFANSIISQINQVRRERAPNELDAALGTWFEQA